MKVRLTIVLHQGQKTEETITRLFNQFPPENLYQVDDVVSLSGHPGMEARVFRRKHILTINTWEIFLTTPHEDVFDHLKEHDGWK